MKHLSLARLMPSLAEGKHAFSMTIRAASVLVAAMLSACAKDPPEVVLVSQAPAVPVIAAECMSAAPAWSDLPDTDVRRSEVARNYRLNKDRYRSLLAKRRICHASLDAQFPPHASKE